MYEYKLTENKNEKQHTFVMLLHIAASHFLHDH